MEDIEQLVLSQLAELKINIKAIAEQVLVDLKKDEKGLLAFAEKYKLPIKFYTAAELKVSKVNSVPLNLCSQ